MAFKHCKTLKSGVYGFTKKLAVIITGEVAAMQACGAITVEGSSLSSGRYIFFRRVTRDAKRTVKAV